MASESHLLQKLIISKLKLTKNTDQELMTGYANICRSTWRLKLSKIKFQAKLEAKLNQNFTETLFISCLEPRCHQLWLSS